MMDQCLKIFKGGKMKKILFVFLFLSSILFAKINDTLLLFNEEQKKEIDTVITKIAENHNIDLYINTYSDDEGFIIDRNQKVIVLNIIKVDKDKIKIELKLSKDMELDEESKNSIEELLGENENTIKNGDVILYIQEMLVGIDEILENIKVEEPIVIEEPEKVENKKNFFVGIGLAILIIFGIIIRVFKKNK